MKRNAPAETASSEGMRGQELPEIIVAPAGPKSREIGSRLAAVESPAFEARRVTREKTSSSDQSPIVYARGLGSNVWDVDGNRYVDLVAGFGALPLGHARPELRAAMNTQADRLGLALGDVYGSDVKRELCEKLAALYPEKGARVMLGLTGADAVTAALKTAVLATGKSGVIAFRGSYHGLSYAPLAACGLNESFREPFAEQLGGHVSFAPFPADAVSLDECTVHVKNVIFARKIGAVLVEPILGRGGCIVPPREFLLQLRALCDEHGALLIVDEIWTGLGRSGAWLASLEDGVKADLVCLGKALGGGLPVSACIGSDRVMHAWAAHGGSAIHTATHFGWPIACATAIATLSILEKENWIERARDVGARWMNRLKLAGFSVQGRGLMIGIKLETSAAALALSRELLKRGYLVLTGGVFGNVITLTPPLDIHETLLDDFTRTLATLAS